MKIYRYMLVSYMWVYLQGGTRITYVGFIVRWEKSVIPRG